MSDSEPTAEQSLLDMAHTLADDVISIIDSAYLVAGANALGVTGYTKVLDHIVKHVNSAKAVRSAIEDHWRASDGAELDSAADELALDVSAHIGKLGAIISHAKPQEMEEQLKRALRQLEMAAQRYQDRSKS